MELMLEQYEKIEELYPDIEVRISKVKGLMSELFKNKNNRQKLTKKRRKHSIGLSTDEN